MMSSSAINSQIWNAKAANVQNADGSPIVASGAWNFRNSSGVTTFSVSDAGALNLPGAINGNVNSYINRLITGIPTNPLVWETGPAGPGSAAFYGGVLLPNGKVFAIPHSYTGTNTIYNPAVVGWPYGQWMLHPMFNTL
jgi:hypothetical protein